MHVCTVLFECISHGDSKCCQQNSRMLTFLEHSWHVVCSRRACRMESVKGKKNEGWRHWLANIMPRFRGVARGGRGQRKMGRKFGKCSKKNWKYLTQKGKFGKKKGNIVKLAPDADDMFSQMDHSAMVNTGLVSINRAYIILFIVFTGSWISSFRSVLTMDSPEVSLVHHIQPPGKIQTIRKNNKCLNCNLIDEWNHPPKTRGEIESFVCLFVCLSVGVLVWCLFVCLFVLSNGNPRVILPYY